MAGISSIMLRNCWASLEFLNIILTHAINYRNVIRSIKFNLCRHNAGLNHISYRNIYGADYYYVLHIEI